MTDALWAKKNVSVQGTLAVLPLRWHLRDTAGVAARLWDEWLQEGTRREIAQACGLADLTDARRFFTFLAAAHDIGKATPVFEAATTQSVHLDGRVCDVLNLAGFAVKARRDEYMHYRNTPHALCSQVILERANVNKNAALIVGAHHGVPANVDSAEVEENYPDYLGLNARNGSMWEIAQMDLLALALEAGDYTDVDDVPSPNMEAQVLLSGLLIMADWVASNAEWFPLLALEEFEAIQQPEYDETSRVADGWKQVDLPKAVRMDAPPDHLFQARFDYAPRLMQEQVEAAARGVASPGIMVLEAPMGSGKTEAALAAAELFAQRTGRSGLFFALPTQATSDGIFPRLVRWTRKLKPKDASLSINLVHGKAQFNPEWQGLVHKKSNDTMQIGADGKDGKDDDVFVHSWFTGRKKALLADYVVGTVDQLLLMALKQKHVMLRHLGLANKVVVVDECHAYDAYMGRYLERALRWLGAYGVPVVVLSATLPAERRAAVVHAYLGDGRQDGSWAHSIDYPLVTYTDGHEVHQRVLDWTAPPQSVQTTFLAEGEEFAGVVDKLSDLLSDGGCAGVILDTVSRAQRAATVLRARFGSDNVDLLHSRFLAPARIEKETLLREMLGKPGEDTQRPHLRIVVGTQVLEQSLDIDFDVMITDIAPTDLLLQRMGRLHRHAREARPDKLREARCFVTGWAQGAFAQSLTAVYDEYPLQRAVDLLNARGEQPILLPDDIPTLVRDAYSQDTPDTEAKRAWIDHTLGKEHDAQAYLLEPPIAEDIEAMLDVWLGEDASGKRGEARVRDIKTQSIEALLVQKQGEGLCFVNGTPLPKGSLTDEQAQAFARQTVTISGQLCSAWRIGDTIADMERITTESTPRAWADSIWLKGELILVLDEDGTAIVNGITIKYTQDDGLSYPRPDSP